MKRILLHTIFWIASAGLLILFIGNNPVDYSFTLAFVGLLLPTAILTSYSFNYYLLPKLLFKKRYLPFVVYALAVIMLSIYLEMMVIVLVFIQLADYTIDNMVPMATNSIAITIGMYFIIFLSTTIYLARRWAKPILPIEEKTFLHVRSDRKMMQLDTNNILMIESMDNYVKIHTVSGITITKEKISKLEEKLPDHFLRAHRSYLVNRQRIDSFTKEKLMLGSIEIPISRTYKDTLLSKIGEASIG